MTRNSHGFVCFISKGRWRHVLHRTGHNPNAVQKADEVRSRFLPLMTLFATSATDSFVFVPSLSRFIRMVQFLFNDAVVRPREV